MKKAVAQVESSGEMKFAQNSLLANIKIQWFHIKPGKNASSSFVNYSLKENKECIAGGEEGGGTRAESDKEDSRS